MKNQEPDAQRTIFSESPVLVKSVKQGIWELCFNRPARCNALSLETLELFTEALQKLAQMPEARILVLRGAGKIFCGGLDLKEAFLGGAATTPLKSSQFACFSYLNDVNKRFPTELGFQMPARVLEILYRLLTLPQTVLAVGQGGAFGGGAGLLAVSDFVLADEPFRLGFPELRRGLRPSLLHPFLKRKLSVSAMKRLLLPGEPISAETARAFGLVQQIVPTDRLDEALEERIAQILAGEPSAAVAAKRQLNETLLPPADELLDGLFDHWKSWKSPEAQEGIAAFLEKRPPKWCR